jgi:threonine dehydrogenase-like Zn-dependent dehydrogenase
VETVNDPSILNPRDAIVETELTAICGSDLHLYNGNIPAMKPAIFSGMSSWAP